jgi:hypothetical protein
LAGGQGGDTEGLDEAEESALGHVEAESVEGVFAEREESFELRWFFMI